jgi:hypothetical protein
MSIESKEPNIHLWDIFNVFEDDSHTCEGLLKKGTICGKKATFQYQKEKKYFTCKTHFPKDIILTKKNQLKHKTVSEYSLQEMAHLLILKMKEIHDTYSLLFQGLKGVYIELQPQVNKKMVFVSHIIYTKLVEWFQERIPVRFVPASRKLKAYHGPEIVCHLKNAYSKRKWLSVQYCIWFLEKLNVVQQKWTRFFTDCSKKDDLSDVFLMAINVLYKKKPFS